MAHEKNDRPEGSRISSKSSSKTRSKPLDFEEVKIGGLTFSVYNDSLMLKFSDDEEFRWALMTPVDAEKLIALLEKYAKNVKI